MSPAPTIARTLRHERRRDASHQQADAVRDAVQHLRKHNIVVHLHTDLPRAKRQRPFHPESALQSSRVDRHVNVPQPAAAPLHDKLGKRLGPDPPHAAAPHPHPDHGRVGRQRDGESMRTVTTNGVVPKLNGLQRRPRQTPERVGVQGSAPAGVGGVREMWARDEGEQRAAMMLRMDGGDAGEALC